MRFQNPGAEKLQEQKGENLSRLVVWKKQSPRHGGEMVWKNRVQEFLSTAAIPNNPPQSTRPRPQAIMLPLKAPLTGVCRPPRSQKHSPKSWIFIDFSLTHKAESYSKMSLNTEYFQIKVDLLNVRSKFLEQVWFWPQNSKFGSAFGLIFGKNMVW